MKNFVSKLVFILILALLAGVVVFYSPTEENQLKQYSQELSTFANEEEFIEYLDHEFSYDTGNISRDWDSIEAPVPVSEDQFMDEFVETSEPERVSETNVQVIGIDEADIVKTDGKNLFVSNNEPIFWRDPWNSRDFSKSTKAVQVWPSDEVELLAEINEEGELLLLEDKLFIFNDEKISAFDITDATEPTLIWDKKIVDATIDSIRLYNNQIYIITQQRVDFDNPCPVVMTQGLEIPCSDIYRPGYPVKVDLIYQAMVIDPNDGGIVNSISFVGSRDKMVVYMSHNALYVSYYRQTPVADLFFSYAEQSQVLPLSVKREIKRVGNYDIGSRAKMVEAQEILERYKMSLSSDDRYSFDNNWTNDFNQYVEKKKREADSTTIVKIDIEGFSIKATGEIPGFLLNQFAMDEYDGYLRIATTVGDRTTSANDIYVLDDSLEIVGSLTDLGLTEKIYSARFIEDKGYLVTFRQIDPFYILDLSNPTNPQMSGELKIPGYSSYLHPISDDIILGIGQEDWQVKASLFDVSDTSNPREISKFLIDENWSEALNNHHAFLLDKKHDIFFLPGSRGGHILSYTNNSLKMIKHVSGESIKRAIYINDYLYLVGWNNIVVVDQNTWETVTDIEI